MTDNSRPKAVRLPPIGEELYEHYAGMSAQTHETAVKEYARRAIASHGLTAGRTACGLKVIYDAPYLAEGEMRLIISHPEKGTFDLIACPYIAKEEQK